MERTESSRLMRGAREVFYEYISELHGRTDDPGRPRRMNARYSRRVSRRNRIFWMNFEVVLGEADSVNCL